MTTAAAENFTAAPAPQKWLSKNRTGLLMLLCAALGVFDGAMWSYMLTRGHDEVVAAQQIIAAEASVAQEHIVAPGERACEMQAYREAIARHNQLRAAGH